MSNFIPSAEHIRDKVNCGTFYQRSAASPAINVAEIARVCYDMRGERCPGLTATKTADVVRRIANSSWNRAHFQYAMTGVQNYTSYGFEGPQYGKSGGVFPLLWIPGPNSEEPEQVFGPQGPPQMDVKLPQERDPRSKRAAGGGGASRTMPGGGGAYDSRSGGGTGTGTGSGTGGSSGGAGGKAGTGPGITVAAMLGGGNGGFPWWLLLLPVAGLGIWWATRGKKRGSKRKR
jgi:hypothetical protein